MADCLLFGTTAEPETTEATYPNEVMCHVTRQTVMRSTIRTSFRIYTLLYTTKQKGKIYISEQQNSINHHTKGQKALLNTHAALYPPKKEKYTQVASKKGTVG